MQHRPLLPSSPLHYNQLLALFDVNVHIILGIIIALDFGLPSQLFSFWIRIFKRLNNNELLYSENPMK